MSEMTDQYPWLRDPWRQLSSQLDRIPHALLLTGLSGLGKNRFAIELASRLLCTESQDDQPCGKCKSCELFAAKTNPDIKIVTPVEEGKSISIDQIRELASYLSLTPHTANYKTVIVTPAEAMTIQAANSLLKQLEEPPGNTVLMLISHASHRLPQTIRSRCTRIELKPPRTSEAVYWLENQGVAQDEVAAVLSASGGAPLAALSLAQQGYADIQQNILAELLAISDGGNPLRCAEQWQKLGSETALRWFHGFLLDVMKQALGASKSIKQDADNVTTAIQAMANRVPSGRVAELADTVGKARQLLTTPVDERLLLEDILIRWNKVYAQ